MEDPIAAAHRIVEKVSRETLMELYNTAAFEDAHQFLLQVAQRRGKLKKGGVPNVDMAARAVLKDWYGGAIPFYTLPPATDDHLQPAEIVSSWGDSFDLNSFLQQQNDAVMNEADKSSSKTSKFSVITSSGPIKMADSLADDNGDDSDTRSMATSGFTGIRSGIRSMAAGTSKNRRKLLAQQRRLASGGGAAGGSNMEDEEEGEEDGPVGESNPLAGLGLQVRVLLALE